MTKTASMAALLHVALQDLRAGKALLAERLPALQDAATDARLVATIASLCDHAAAGRERLDALNAGEGPNNLWMRGILDDADRDARSHLPGAILDVALVGALRKACAAEVVSFDTAVALARRDAGEMVTVLEALREATMADHAAFRALLEQRSEN